MFRLAAKAIFSGIFAYLGAALTFLTTKPGVYVLIVGVAGGAYWYSGHVGYRSGVSDTVHAQKLAEEIAVNAAYKVALKQQADLDKGLSADADAAGFARGQAQSKTVILYRKVPVYVTAETDVSFPMPCGLIKLHDAAALGVSPEAISNPAGLSDDVACPVKASDLAAVIIENYGLDHEKDAQIIGLQNLARTLQATIEGGK